jgi:HK97 family phage prohead protease
MNYLNLPTEFKAVGDAGTFEGYASVFGNVDLGGDVIQAGAFKEIVTNAAGQVTVLWQHGQSEPIGVADVKADARGLRFKGQLVLADPAAQRAYAHIKAGSVRGMSIGYDVLAGGAEILSSGIRALKALKLWEISVVTFGMNPMAGIDAVKQLNTVRELERDLRQRYGLSSRQAKSVATSMGGYLDLSPGADQPDPDDVAALVAQINNLTSLFERQYQ